MKIMFYINTLAGGGAQRVMANLANLFVEDGDEVIFVTSFSAEQEYVLQHKVKRISLSQDRISSSIKRNLAYIFGLRKVIRDEKPDILVGFMREPNVRVVLSSIGLPVKTLISVRVDPKVEYKGRSGRIMAKYLLPLADGCVFQTEQAKQWFVESLQQKSNVIPNAVKPDFYEIEGKPVPGRFVTLGRLDTQKNHKLLIEAFCDAADKYPQAELLIYGDGRLKPELQQQIIDAGMETRIRMMGQTADVSGVLSEAGCFVLSSDYEGMPNALMEALAAGVPCISTDCPCGGPQMLIEHGKNGLLVPVGDRKGLAEAMEKVLAEPGYAQMLGKEAKISAEDFRPEIIFSQWKSYMKKICEET